MHGGLALRSGVLFVGRHAGTARVAPFDLDGRRLSPGFTFGGGSAGRAAITGMAVDEDRRLWVADAAARCLRIFTAFGRSLGELGSEDEAGPDGERVASTDRPGDLGRPVDVAVRGADVEQELIVASGGRRRHGLHVLPVEAGDARSLRPLGDPRGHFEDLTALAARGEYIWTCEGRAGRVQVFRRDEFHFSFLTLAEHPQDPVPLRPQGLALLGDGRALLALGGEGRSGLWLVDGAGKRLAILAEAGMGEGSVWEPTRLAVEEATTDRQTRLAVLDRDGDRVQVFNLEGRCYGSFLDLP